MDDKKISEILEILNSDFGEDVDDIITIDGINCNVHEDSSMHSSEISESLYFEDVEFSRTGRKIISYERWVDTIWSDWE